MEMKARIAHLSGPDPQRGWSKAGEENSAKLYRKGVLNIQDTEELSDARVRATTHSYDCSL